MNLLLKIRTYRTRIPGAAIILFCTLALAACNKSLDARLPSVSNGLRDSSANIRTFLAHSPYTLFNKIYTRAAIDSPYSFYTVFMPSDSAMTAAGLTSAAIDALSVDSLYKIVAYHILPGMLSDTTLQQDTITSRILTLRQDIVYAITTNIFGTSTSTKNYYPQYLYLNKKGGTLYANGQPAGQATAIKVSNGYIYPINQVLFGPTRHLWNTITSRPELSMYTAAYRLLDSFTMAQGNFYASTYDTLALSTVWYTPLTPYNLPILNLTTVLAPTNTAFANAGFHTVDDLRQLVTRSTGGIVYITPPGQTNQIGLYQYDAMDSVLKAHFFSYPGQGMIFYQDMLYSPVINNGAWNTNPFWPGIYKSNPTVTPFYTNFSNVDGTLSIQWSRNPAIPPASIPFDPSRSLMTTNGILYEIDQLFYPQN